MQGGKFTKNFHFSTVSLLSLSVLSVDVDKFTQMFMSFCIPPFNEAQIVSAFQVFDKAGTNFANEGELKYVLENLGKDIPKETIEDFLKCGQPADNGNIDYAAYAKRLIER